MGPKSTSVVVATSALFTSLLVPSPAAAAPNYQVRLLESLPGTFSQAWAINSEGEIGGRSVLEAVGNFTAVVWPKSHQVVALSPDDGNNASTAYGLNDSGVAVGTKDLPDGTHAFLWQNGQATDLPSLAAGSPYRNEYAAAINAHGQIVGQSYDPSMGGRAVTWINGAIVNLTPDTETHTAGATDVSDSGVVVGSRNGRAVKWQGSAMVDLNLALPTNFPIGATPFGDARSINRDGDIVGYIAWSGNNTSGYYAFYWSNGVTTILRPFGSAHPHCIAYDINDRDEVVGECNDGTGAAQAFYWSNGSMIGLDPLPGGTVSSALAINNKGVVVGHSQDEDGNHRAVRWS